MIEFDPLSPEWYPHFLTGKNLVFTNLTKAEYKASSFFDRRLHHTYLDTVSKPVAELSTLLFFAPRVPVNFIFHMGHCGSTLISRLLDVSNEVLSIREPVPLKNIHTAFKSLSRIDPANAITFDTLVRFWSRAFPDTKQTIVKATSNIAGSANFIRQLLPSAKMLFLGVSAENYLATYMSHDYNIGDLRIFAPELHKRLVRFGFDIPPLRYLSPGETAGMSWLAEYITQWDHITNHHREHCERMMFVNFDMFLNRPQSRFAEICEFFNVPFDGFTADHWKILRRYSKDQSRAFSLLRRRAQLERSKETYADAIAEGLRFVERVRK